LSDQSEKKMMDQIMKPILKLGMKVSVETLEAYDKFIQELINLRKTGG